MSDRELLQLAAKAAGIRINHWVYDDLDSSPAVLESGETWNPRDDDGDALRLAVKLRMQIDILERSTYALALNGTKVCEVDRADPLAATRRAIFRAAAEIGRAMK